MRLLISTALVKTYLSLVIFHLLVVGELEEEPTTTIRYSILVFVEITTLLFWKDTLLEIQLF